MTELTGHYYDGIHPIARSATLELGIDSAILKLDGLTEAFSTNGLVVSPAVGGSHRFIDLPNGGQFSCFDHSSLKVLAQESATEGPLHWLEHRWAVALTSVALIVGALTFGYFKGLPLLAESLAREIPLEKERAIGEEVIKVFDRRSTILSNLNADKKKEIYAAFNNLLKDLPDAKSYRLEIRDLKGFGPNAFALPGGIIVLTDDLVAFSISNEEIAAVLAHEIGHEELRHSLRALLQGSAIGVLAAALTHDGATVGGAITGAPIVLAQLKYSREFEAAADDYALDLMKRRGISPLALTSFMERLTRKYGESGEAPSLLSSHPQSSARARKAFAAGMDFDHPVEVPDYKMVPNFRFNDKVIVKKLDGTKGLIPYGAVIATYTQLSGFCLRRVIGLPGDSVEMDGYRLSVNRKDRTSSTLETKDCLNKITEIYDQGHEFGRRSPKCFYELSGGNRYLVFSTSHPFRATVVPKGSYFAIEDNRMELTPSLEEESKLVPSESIVGIVKP